MSVPPFEVQAMLLRETLGLLASYSWHATVTLGPTELGSSNLDLSLPEFFREFRLRHALATAEGLRPILDAIEVSASHMTGIERVDTRGTLSGRLDTPRYLARRATLRSLPRPYPVVRSIWAHNTPENILARQGLELVRIAMRDNPFPLKSAESAATERQHGWVVNRSRQRPWADIQPVGLIQRLYNEVGTRIRRRQTGNEPAYAQLLRWFDQWAIDLHRLGDDDRNEIIRGVLAFPTGPAFWDKVFEVWTLTLISAAAERTGWSRVQGPAALHRPDGQIYRYMTQIGREVVVWFQRSEPLPTGRWTYRDGGPLRGIPDITLAADTAGSSHLLIDAKNRFVRSERISRSEETYKMLGYAENFRMSPSETFRFAGLLIFPSDRTGHRVLDGPDGGRLDLVAVNMSEDRGRAHEALGNVLSAWAGVD